MPQLTKWLKDLVRRFWVLPLVLIASGLHAQTLTLNDAYQKAEEQYPLTRQKDLVRQAASISLENIRKGYWPQAVINGQASYQSDVTSVNIPLPGFKMDPPSKDQYKLTADVSQLLYDGGLIHQQQLVQAQSGVVEEQKLEVELYRLRDRITQIYLGILLLDQQLKQLELVNSDLQAGIRTVQAQVDNGLALRSHLNTLKAEVLRSDQRRIELTMARKGMVDILGLFLNQTLPDTIILELPASTEPDNRIINRPEIKLFREQDVLFKEQKKLIDTRNLPRASAFVQGGYGRPGLNMLKNEFEPFYILGIRVNWSLSGLYTMQKEKELVENSRRALNIQKEVFLLNTNTQLKQINAEIEKWKQLVATDKDIIDLRSEIKQAARAQLENQVITANDYLRELNAEDTARQNMMLHQLQLIQARINYANTAGTYNTIPSK